MLPEPVMLRMGDAFELDDGTFVDIVIESEPLIEARGNDLTHLARLAWHLGDRHVPVQVMPNRLRLRRDPALEAMLAALGARLTPIEAPFDPEGGAYATHAVHESSDRSRPCARTSCHHDDHHAAMSITDHDHRVGCPR